MIESSVTICIPVFNGEKYIRDAIDSALSQDIKNLTVIVGNNVSTDKTSSIVAEYTDPRLKVLDFTEHFPMVENWNRTIAQVKTEYFLLLSADDILLPGAMTHLVDALKNHPECILAYGAAEVFQESGSPGAFDKPLAPPQTGVNNLEDQILKNGLAINVNGTLFRNRQIRFDPQSGLVCDLEIFLRLSRSGCRALGIPETVVAYRKHADALSSNHVRMWEATLKVLRQYLIDAVSPEKYQHRISRILLWTVITLVSQNKRQEALRLLANYETILPFGKQLLPKLVVTFPPLGTGILSLRKILSSR